MSDQARVKLIQALSDLSDLPENSDLSDGDRVKALRSLAQSVAALTNPAKDNQIAELKRKLREKDDEIEAAEKEHAAEIARLNFELKKRDDEIAELRKLAGTVDNEAVTQKLNESVGLT